MVTAVLLAGCTSEVDKAQKRYDMVKASAATSGEVCAAGKAVVAAYLDAGDQQKYREAMASTNIECMSRELEEKYGLGRNSDGTAMTRQQADDLTAAADNAMNYADQQIRAREIEAENNGAVIDE